MANSTSIAKSFKLVNQGNLDGWYGPYDSIALANAGVPAGIRLHKKVGINTGAGVVEYWWNGGTADGNLVPAVDLTPALSQIPILPGKPQIMGVENPSMALNATDRAYFFDVTVPKDGVLSRIIIPVANASTLYIKRFVHSADRLTYIYLGQISIPVVAGMNTLVIPQQFVFNTGDVLCLYCPGLLQYNTDSMWSPVRGLGTVKNITTNQTISALSLSTEGVSIQVRFEFEGTLFGAKSTLNSVIEKVISSIGNETKVFGDSDPIVSTAAADRAYFIETSLPYDGILRRINIPINVTSGTSAVLYVKRFKKSSDNLRYVYQNQMQFPVQNGSNIISVSEFFTFETGDIIGLYCLGGSLNLRVDESAWSNVRGGAGITNITSDVALSLLSTSTASIQVAFEIETFTGSSAIDPMITPSPEGYWMVPCYGQSLSINTDAGSSTFTEIVPIAYTQTGTHANVQDMNGGYAEMFLAMSKEYKTLPSDFKMMTCLGGAGGRSVLQLSKGSTFYTTLLNNIRAGKATADVANKPYNVPAFIWTQGEEDYRSAGVPANYGSGEWNPNLYKAKLKTLLDDLNVDIKAITGQKNHVKMIMYQTGSHNAYYRYPRIAIQQLELALEDDRVSLAKTMYEADYNTADYVHAPAKTYRNMGNHYGIALYNATVKNERVLPISPTQHFIVGTDVYIKFYTPFRPLVFDTTTVAPLPDGKFGFNLYTVANETNGGLGTITPAAQSITSVTLFGPDVVKLSLSAVPSVGTRLTYGVNGDGSNSINGTINGVTGKSGRTSGARGNLRDSRGYMNPVANYFTLYNWCPIFEIVL